MVLDIDENVHFQSLNKRIRESADGEVVINGCVGQRYIATGLSGKNITINGTPGNALGAYLNGCDVTVNGNAQDATGDTMNGGRIIIHGNSGDATGDAMRGGVIYIKGNTGYRAGIHMKAYKELRPVIVVGGRAGSFLGEYQAGGLIIVLGLHTDRRIVGNFPGTGRQPYPYTGRRMPSSMKRTIYGTACRTRLPWIFFRKQETGPPSSEACGKAVIFIGRKIRKKNTP